MIPRPLKNFVSELLEATDRNDVSWSEGAPDSYYCNHKKYTLHIQYHFDTETGQASILFRISISGKDSTFQVVDGEGDYFLMKNLYSSVSVNANDFGSIDEDFFS